MNRVIEMPIPQQKKGDFQCYNTIVNEWLPKRVKGIKVYINQNCMEQNRNLRGTRTVRFGQFSVQFLPDKFRIFSRFCHCWIETAAWSGQMTPSAVKSDEMHTAVIFSGKKPFL
jgi:hypothetical protein